MNSELLLFERLRDIQVPAGVSVWPLAPGWWLLLTLLSAVLVAGSIFWYRRRALRRAALKELAGIQDKYRRDHNSAALAMGISTLLRRVALAREPRSPVAGLCGDAWLAYLNRRGETDAFTRGAGRVLASLPYGSGEPVDVSHLVSLAKGWVCVNT